MDRDFIRRLKGYEILTDEGREIVEQIITSPPARSVGRYSITSISGEFPSEKLGESVQYESKGCEKCFVHLSEIDSGTTCIFSQPWEIIVLATDCRGRKGPRPKTFDFLEITPSLFSFVEAKPVEKIRIEQKKSPVDWVELEPNCWKYLPGELKAKSYGMGCKVFCPQFYSKAFLSNLAFRVCITQDALSEQELGRVEILKKHLIKRPHTVNSLCELIGNVRASLIFRAISQGLLFGLPELQLFEPDFLVYGTEAEADRTRSELYQYALPTTELLGPMARRLERASATERLAARSGLKRYKAAREAEHKKKKWDYAVDKRLKAVAAEGAPELAAYIPDFQGRGSHESKIDSETLESIKKDIRTHWPQLHKPCIAALHTDLKVKADESGKYFPSREKFRQIFHARLSPEKAALLIAGKRARDAARPTIDGQKSFARLNICGLHVHLDGVYGDNYSKEFEEIEFARPIFYPLVDDFSGYVIARGIKVGKPSRLATAMAMRDCYKRTGSVPKTIFHDWGPEFENDFFSEMASQFGFDNEKRPAGAPRFGGRGESFNSALNNYLQSLAGGTYFDQAGRKADGSKKGRKHAEYDLAVIVREVDKWIFEIWNKTPIAGGTESPEGIFVRSKKYFPEAFVDVLDTPLNRYVTSMPLNIKAFDYRRGVRFGGDSYSSDDYAAALIRNDDLTGPRLDSNDPALIWLMTSKGPISLASQEHTRMSGIEIGGRMESLQKMLRYDATSKDNQYDRSYKESKSRRDLKRSIRASELSEHNPETSMPSSKPITNASNEPDFSSVDLRNLPKFKRLGEVE